MARELTVIVHQTQGGPVMIPHLMGLLLKVVRRVLMVESAILVVQQVALEDKVLALVLLAYIA